MSGCEAVKQTLCEFLDGELPGELRKAVEVHLRQCADCRTELDELRAAVRAVQSLPRYAAPASILTGVRSALRETVAPSHTSVIRVGEAFARPKPEAPWRYGWLSATALLAMGVLVFTVARQHVPDNTVYDSAIPAQEFEKAAKPLGTPGETHTSANKMLESIREAPRTARSGAPLAAPELELKKDARASNGRLRSGVDRKEQDQDREQPSVGQSYKAEQADSMKSQAPHAVKASRHELLRKEVANTIGDRKGGLELETQTAKTDLAKTKQLDAPQQPAKSPPAAGVGRGGGFGQGQGSDLAKTENFGAEPKATQLGAVKGEKPASPNLGKEDAANGKARAVAESGRGENNLKSDALTGDARKLTLTPGDQQPRQGAGGGAGPGAVESERLADHKDVPVRKPEAGKANASAAAPSLTAATLRVRADHLDETLRELEALVAQCGGQLVTTQARYGSTKELAAQEGASGKEASSDKAIDRRKSAAKDAEGGGQAMDGKPLGNSAQANSGAARANENRATTRRLVVRVPSARQDALMAALTQYQQQASNTKGLDRDAKNATDAVLKSTLEERAKKVPAETNSPRQELPPFPPPPSAAAPSGDPPRAPDPKAPQKQPLMQAQAPAATVEESGSRDLGWETLQIVIEVQNP